MIIEVELILIKENIHNKTDNQIFLD